MHIHSVDYKCLNRPQKPLEQRWFLRHRKIGTLSSQRFDSCVSFRSARLHARKSCATQQLDAVGFAKFVKFEKWCLLLKGSSCPSSLLARLSRCLSEQRARTRDLQAWCAEATLPRALDHKRYLFKKIASIVQLKWTQISYRHTGIVRFRIVKLCVFLNSFVTSSLSTAFSTPPYPTSFNFTIWCSIWGVECNVPLCRTWVNFASHEGVFSHDL